MSDKIKILHVIASLGMGGAEMLVKNLVCNGTKAHFDFAICVLYPARGSSIEKELQQCDIPVYYLRKRLGPDIGVISDLLQVIRTYKPHVMHTHGYAIRYAVIPAVAAGVQVKIHTVHNIAEREVDAVGKVVNFVAFRWLKVKPVGISNQVVKSIERLYGVRDVPCIFNGIPVNRYRRDDVVRAQCRRSFNISDNAFFVLHIGRFSPQKNHGRLLSAFAEVQSSVSTVSLMLVGDGELRPEIEALAASRRLNVIFAGIRDDVPDLLAACDLVVLSSDWEGLPLVILEAMAAGRPIVATAVGGVPELIENNVNGILVPADDDHGFAKAILRLALNPDAAVSMGRSGSDVFKGKYDIRATTQEYEKLYRYLYAS